MASLASEADYVFIPEDPVPHNWPDKLCKKILQVRIKGAVASHLESPFRVLPFIFL